MDEDQHAELKPELRTQRLLSNVTGENHHKVLTGKHHNLIAQLYVIDSRTIERLILHLIMNATKGEQEL
jgi:hypothetical protein